LKSSGDLEAPLFGQKKVLRRRRTIRDGFLGPGLMIRIGTEELEPFLPSGGLQLIEAEIGGNTVDPGGKFSFGFVAFGSLPDPQKHFLGQVFGLCPVPDKAINKVQNQSLMEIHQDFKSDLIPPGRFSR